MRQFPNCINLLLIILFPAFTHAQTRDTINIAKPDSFYIESMDQYLTFKLSINNDIQGFVVKNTVQYDIQPNDNNALKLSVNYRWLSVSYSASPKFIPGNDDEALKGETKTSAFSFSFNFSHWMQALSYNYVKGYYLHNTSTYRNPWMEGVDPYIQFPDLVYKSFAGRTAYKFNKNFSFNAFGSQTERQLKSAGTFVPAIAYNYYIVDDKTPLTGQNSSQKSNNLEALLALGYFYTYTIRKAFYISAGAIPAAGIITTKLLTRLLDEDVTTHYTTPIFRLEGGFALGYNAERFFAGVQLISSSEAYNQNKASNVVETDHLIYQIFTGYRFNAPGFLKRTLNKAEETGSGLFK